jgi:putative ABC transport system ATP-binding protein
MSGRPTSGFVLDQVSLTLAGTPLLHALNTSIPPGECTAVMGASGAGKTTLLRVLNRLEEPTRGRVLLEGVPLPELDVLALRRRVALVAQRPVALTERVEDEIRVGRPTLDTFELSELLARVGLPAEFAGRAMTGLSGGETQRVCLARALAIQPQVLLLDEPTSALDERNTALITQLVRDHLTGGGTTVLVSHDLTLVRGLAHQILVLDRGRLAAAGPPTKITVQDIVARKAV